MLKASFIQSWYCGSFDDKKWESEFFQMKKIGIDTLILGDIFELETKKQGGRWSFYFDCNLPFIGDYKKINNDIIEQVFEKAEKYNMKIFIGTGGYNDWWRFGGHSKRIIDFYKKAADICEYIFNKSIKNHLSAFAGWYFNPEISNVPMLGVCKNLITAMNILIEKLNFISPDKPLMLSPYYNQYIGKSLKETAFEKDWAYLISSVNFRKFDILAPQDAIGAGWITFDYFDKVMNMYNNAIKRGSNLKDGSLKLKFWINCENFTQNHSGSLFSPPKTQNTRFIPADINRFIKQLEMSKKYTDTIITFSFNHYYSQNAVNPDYFKALEFYIKNNSCQENDFLMTEIKYKKENDYDKLFWEKPESDWSIIAYIVEKNDKFLNRIDQKKENENDLSCEFISIKSFKKNDVFSVYAIDVWGNFSKKSIKKIN